jgi:hypothetical protein
MLAAVVEADPDRIDSIGRTQVAAERNIGCREAEIVAAAVAAFDHGFHREGAG